MSTSSNDSSSLLALGLTERRLRLEEFLATSVEELLELDPGEVDRDSPLYEYGLDSMAGLELKRRIEEKTGVELPIADYLEGPSVTRVALVLASALDGSNDSPSSSAQQGGTPPRPADGGPPRLEGDALVGVLEAYRDDALGLFRNAREQLGDLFRFRIGPHEAVYVGIASEAARIVSDHEHFHKSTNWDRTRASLGDGVLLTNGETWQAQRSRLQPGFDRAALSAVAVMAQEVADEIAEDWLATIESGGGSVVIDVTAAMRKFALSVVGRYLLSLELDTERVLEAMSTVSEDGAETVDIQLDPEVSAARQLRVAQALEVVDALVYGEIDARLEDQERRPPDLLSSLLAGADNEHAPGARRTDESTTAMSRLELRDNIVTLMVAGYHTTALTLSLALDTLSRHPELAAVLRTEAAGALGGKPPGVDEMRQLPIHQAVLDETLRLYPPGWIISREALEPVELGDWTAPVGTLLVTSPFLTHRDARHWPEPERFLPERFLSGSEPIRVGGHRPDDLPGPERGAYLPFGLGPRRCIGAAMATIEFHAVLVSLLARFSLAPTGAEPPQLGVMISLATAGPVLLDVAPLGARDEL